MECVCERVCVRERERDVCKYPPSVFNVGGDHEVACVICY